MLIHPLVFPPVFPPIFPPVFFSRQSYRHSGHTNALTPGVLATYQPDGQRTQRLVGGGGGGGVYEGGGGGAHMHPPSLPITTDMMVHGHNPGTLLSFTLTLTLYTPSHFSPLILTLPLPPLSLTHPLMTHPLTPSHTPSDRDTLRSPTPPLTHPLTHPLISNTPSDNTPSDL